MALFIFAFLILSNCIRILLGSESSERHMLIIKSTAVTGDQNLIFYKVDETLNLTCSLISEQLWPDAVLEWVVDNKMSNSLKRLACQRGTNDVSFVKENVQESDAGEYTCRVMHNGTPYFNFERTIMVRVKNKKKECTDVMFQCSPGICIQKRYTCDGFRDCPHGEDESPNYCGPGNPCDNKLMCPDYRCIPFTWCCESHREPNCTTKVKHSCCTHVEKLTRDVDNDIGFQLEQQRFSDMGFLQTTVYTVIGCAMAFMFIVTIIVIAICRVHVRRTLLSRCPAAARHLALGRGGNVHGNGLSAWSFYDLDLYLNRAGLSGNDLMSVNPLLVTYNINNGVQFVGHTIDPPPYCEIVTSPPKEGPPPPYASRENMYLYQEVYPEEPQYPPPATEFQQSEAASLLDDGQHEYFVEIVPSTAEDISSLSEGMESWRKERSRPCSSYNASRYATRQMEESENWDYNMGKVGRSDSEAGSVKYHFGESSSHGASELNDAPKGAARKLYNSNTLDGDYRVKNKSYSVHDKRF